MAATPDVGYAAADSITLEEATSGKFERAISMFRTSYSFVSQSRGKSSELPSILWVAQYAPHSASYIPLYVESENVPEALSTGSLHEVDHASLYWPSAIVGNWVGRLYDVAYPLVQAKIEDIHTHIHESRRKAEKRALETKTLSERTKILSSLSNETSHYALEEWWALFWDLCSKVKDGQRLDDLHTEKLKPVKAFYPRRWLDEIGYFPRQESWKEGLVVSLDVLKYGLAFLLGAFASSALQRRKRPPSPARAQATDYGVVSAEMT